MLVMIMQMILLDIYMNDFRIRNITKICSASIDLIDFSAILSNIGNK